MAVGPGDTANHECPSPSSINTTQLSSVSLSSTPSRTSFTTALESNFEVAGEEIDLTCSQVSEALEATEHTSSGCHVVLPMSADSRMTEMLILNRNEGGRSNLEAGTANQQEEKTLSKGVHFADPIAVIKSQTSLSSLNSDRRACRICQSETGDMVRPCACAGTMGDIHENCLNTWIQRSNRGNTCEICKQEYSRSGKVFKPLLKWSKPRMKEGHLFEAITAGGLIFSIYYMWLLLLERGFYQRIILKRGFMRSHDIARLMIFLLLLLMLLKGIYIVITRFMYYLRKQQTVHFVDNPGCQQQSTSQ